MDYQAGRDFLPSQKPKYGAEYDQTVGASYVYKLVF